ncbi:MAG: hypothetical protein GC150_14780 [Rhizobiales bacterium]|nr:hypothetical protein [Hyphomicrobiales bacterium]
MQSRRAIQVVAAHAEGEVGRVIVGGVIPPRGASVRDMRIALAEDDTLRQFLIREPRGGVFTHYNLVVPACHPDAQAGFIIMEPTDYPPMSGSNSICVGTVLLETGMLQMHEPVTELVLETPGGLVHLTAECENGRCRSIKTRNAAAFVVRLDLEIDVPGLGPTRVDIAYGGGFFALLDAAPHGLEVRPEAARDLVVLGERVKDAVNAAFPVAHPEMPEIAGVTFVTWREPVHQRDGHPTARNATVISPGKIDRSPCGTASSARLAVHHARGEMKVGDTLHSRSIIDSLFEMRIEAETTVAGRPAILPSIKGRAWITGEHTYHLDPEDPYPLGYALSDTWHRVV